MKTFSLVVIFLVASLCFAQDCNNPLLSFFNIPGLDSPQSGQDLPYCSNLQNGETCCSGDIVTGFQDRVNNVIDKLNNYFAAKDLYLQQLRDKYLARFNKFLQNITENHTDELEELRGENATLADQFQNDIDTADQLSADAQTINKDFRQAIYDYQQIRQNCFAAALQIHTGAWCLACDPNYASQGVADDGSITFTDDICQYISDHCWRFFDQGAKFNPLIRAREAYWRLRAISNYLNDFSNGSDAVPLNVSGDPYNPLSTQLAITVPDQWEGNNEEAGTTEQCADLWIGDELLAELLTFGPPVAASTIETEEFVLTSGEVVVNGRILVVGVILAGLAGLTIGLLANDPGDLFGDTDLSDLDEVDIFKVRIP